MAIMKTILTLKLNICADILSAQKLSFFFNSLKIIAVLISSAAISCASDNKATSDGVEISTLVKASLDNATELVIDSTDHRFDSFDDANIMLVYKDSILIVNNKNPHYDDPLISLYDINDQMHHLADYIPHGSDADKMTACRIHIAGDKLFVSDCFYTKKYCVIPLRKPLSSAGTLRLSVSGVEERGVAITPFRNGLLVENPQCYSNDEAGIHNDVTRLLHYRNGRCLNPYEPVAFQVADVNTGADIHYNESCRCICFVSHRQPLVEFYDDSLQLIHSIRLQSEDFQKIHIESTQTTSNSPSNDIGRGNVSFERTRRVVGAGSQLHSFLCSAANDEHIYLVYCGRLFSHAYHTYPTYILVLDWYGKVVNTYRYDRWIQAISPSTETGTFYLTVYADDAPDSARMKLVKVTPEI